jgi:hypothetical protein
VARLTPSPHPSLLFFLSLVYLANEGRNGCGHRKCWVTRSDNGGIGVLEGAWRLSLFLSDKAAPASNIVDLQHEVDDGKHEVDDGKHEVDDGKHEVVEPSTFDIGTPTPSQAAPMGHKDDSRYNKI